MADNSIISEDFQHGLNFTHGEFCIIDPDVIVGNDVKLGHYVHLKSGTRFGNRVTFADYCCTTGLCYVGDDVNIRTRTTISKAVIVEPRVFIGGGVMTSHTKHVPHQRPGMVHEQFITRIGVGAIVGSGCTLMAGIDIGADVIVGYGSNIVGDLLEPGIYIGNPAKWFGAPPPEWYVGPLDNHEPHQFPPDLLKKYLPNAVIE